MMIEMSQPPHLVANKKSYDPWPFSRRRDCQTTSGGSPRGREPSCLRGFAGACRPRAGHGDLTFAPRNENYFAAAREAKRRLSHQIASVRSRPRKKSSSAWPMRGVPLARGAAAAFFFFFFFFFFSRTHIQHSFDDPRIHPSAVRRPRRPRLTAVSAHRAAMRDWRERHHRCAQRVAGIEFCRHRLPVGAKM